MQTRRKFFEGLGGGVAALGLAAQSSRSQDRVARAQGGEAPRLAAPPISFFSKPFQNLSFDALGARVAQLGFRGIELPVRKRGHIEAAAVEDELPKALESFRRAGVELTIMTTDILDASAPHVEKTLRTAAKLGVKSYRLGWFRYKRGKPIKQQVLDCLPRVRELAALNKEVGIQGLLQNHSGAQFIGSTVWDYALLLEDVSPDEVGVVFDLAHATIEGGKTWPNHVDLLWPHVRALYAKDYVWAGKKTRWVPFGTGNVSADFYRKLAKRGFDGPISLHVEYERKANAERMGQILKRDRASLERLLTAPASKAKR